MQFHGEVSIVIYNKVKSCFRNTQISSRESLLKPAHGFAVTMITILLVVCAAYEKTAEAARSEFYTFRTLKPRTMDLGCDDDPDSHYASPNMTFVHDPVCHFPSVACCGRNA